MSTERPAAPRRTMRPTAAKMRPYPDSGDAFLVLANFLTSKSPNGSKQKVWADADAGSALGRFAARKAERWRFEQTSITVGEQRKGQVLGESTVDSEVERKEKISGGAERPGEV